MVNFFLYSESGFSVIALLLIIFCNGCLLYFILAKFYFFFIDPPQKENNENKDFYGITISHNKPIPYEVRNVNDKSKNNKNKKVTEVEKNKSIDKSKEYDSARYDLVNTKIINQ